MIPCFCRIQPCHCKRHIRHARPVNEQKLIKLFAIFAQNMTSSVQYPTTMSIYVYERCHLPLTSTFRLPFQIENVKWRMTFSAFTHHLPSSFPKWVTLTSQTPDSLTFDFGEGGNAFTISTILIHKILK